MGNRIRKIMAWLAVFVMLAATAAGCADTSTEGPQTSSADSEAKKYDFGGVTIRIASPYKVELTPGKNAKTDLLIERIQYMEKNWNVKVEYPQIDAGQYWENMVTAIMGGEAYGDILFAFPWFIMDWVAGGAAKDVKDLLKDYDLNDGSWSRMVIGDCTIGDSVYGFYRGYDELQYGLVYNPRLFAAEGLTDPNQLLAGGGKWDFDTFRDYANRLTKRDTDGRITQYGVLSGSLNMTMASFVLANGGSYVDYSTEIPTLALGSPQSLQAMEYLVDMVTKDQTMAAQDWEQAMQSLVGGTAAMYLCEEWAIEYMQQYAAENGLEGSYALTYFPVGPSGTEFIDASYGGSTYFIPSTISDEKAKIALQVYAYLNAPTAGESIEEYAHARGEELFNDEASVNVYTDIIASHRIRSSGYCRVGLREMMDYLASDICSGDLGTPRALVDRDSAELTAIIKDSGYVKTLQKQSQ